MKKAYVTILRSIDYLPGVLVLNHSLRKVAAGVDELVVFTSPAIPDAALVLLAQLGIATQPVEEPFPTAGGQMCRRRISNYYKLCALSLTQYDKVVYLDADMLVCGNLDALFEKEKWSAVNAGGLLSWLYNWMDADSGLVVLEPGRPEFETLLKKAGTMHKDVESQRSFLSLFCPAWYEAKNLHLDLHYNVGAAYLDRYCALYNYQLAGGCEAGAEEVKVIHFQGKHKPWNTPHYHTFEGLYRQAFEAWHAHFGEMLAELPAHLGYAFRPQLLARASAL